MWIGEFFNCVVLLSNLVIIHRYPVALVELLQRVESLEF